LIYRQEKRKHYSPVGRKSHTFNSANTILICFLSPNACGLEGVDIAYEILDDLLDPTGPLAELVGTEGE